VRLNTLVVDYVFDEMEKGVSERKNHFIFKNHLSTGEIQDVDVYSGLLNNKMKYLLYSKIHDITDPKKKLRIQKQISDEPFTYIFYQFTIGFRISKLDFKSLRVKFASSQMLGYSKEELLSMKFPDYTFKKKKWGKSFLVCGYFFSLGIIAPPKTIRIASINPAIGTPVCCNGIVFVSAFIVAVELFPVFIVALELFPVFFP
jgi:hypothetical protein